MHDRHCGHTCPTATWSYIAAAEKRFMSHYDKEFAVCGCLLGKLYKWRQIRKKERQKVLPNPIESKMDQARKRTILAGSLWGTPPGMKTGQPRDCMCQSFAERISDAGFGSDGLQAH
mmetsp:Transcript_52214/g.93666  ORF Transcript_52214/g.93666 Transcript_52214/m.93666 type:complete len:117 (-) Transcript_52214:95-445(-)